MAKNNTILISHEELAHHTSKHDAWISIHGNVYNITDFLEQHPGGAEILLDTLNNDATSDFEDIGHSDSARKMLDKFYVGQLEEPFSKQEPHKLSSESDSTLNIRYHLGWFAGITCGVAMYLAVTGMSFEIPKIGFG